MLRSGLGVGEKRVEEKNMRETIKHENFTKYARKMTELHLITSIREAGRVDITPGREQYMMIMYC